MEFVGRPTLLKKEVTNEIGGSVRVVPPQDFVV